MFSLSYAMLVVLLADAKVADASADPSAPSALRAPALSMV